MKSYIGTKIVAAEPMSKMDFEKRKGNDYQGEDAPGYFVQYEDGYQSWSPQEVFERCYRPITSTEADIIQTYFG